MKSIPWRHRQLGRLSNLAYVEECGLWMAWVHLPPASHHMPSCDTHHGFGAEHAG